MVYKLTDSDHTLIKIWEILNNKGIVESALTEDIVDAKWNKDGLSTHEFVTLTQKNIYFWKMKRDRTLQFHCINVKDLGGKMDNYFCSFNFFRIVDEYKTVVLLIGTKYGGLVFLDCRSATVIGYTNKLFNEPVRQIEPNPKVICFTGQNSNNLYGFRLQEKQLRSLGEFMMMFDSLPDILSFDGKVSCIHFPA